MNADTRIALALLALVILVLAWIGGTVACVVYACQPGNAGALVLAMLVACGGWAFVHEAREHVGGLV